MTVLKDLDKDNLTADTCNVREVTADTICGVTAKEFSCLKGCKTNIQDRINTIKNGADTLLRGWQ